ncbi:hypothetical protein B0H67DRAFT_218256 [Lasiosphaeris hirsuta]|uniref:Uncharacterized protein n=1 Tax=Lasiosphaeris hirsuta TaxID=260670 RepID=A0AA40AF07_9PEZI|nr:hypothetical protein B0H67DRAFT_218256 [Lasiosphaeris hirsuta]
MNIQPCYPQNNGFSDTRNSDIMPHSSLNVSKFQTRFNSILSPHFNPVFTHTPHTKNCIFATTDGYHLCFPPELKTAYPYISDSTVPRNWSSRFPLFIPVHSPPDRPPHLTASHLNQNQSRARTKPCLTISCIPYSPEPKKNSDKPLLNVSRVSLLQVQIRYSSASSSAACLEVQPS